jgi:hypothetical protein
MAISITILCAWLLADFLSGVAHWAQDRVLAESKSKFWNQVIADNVLHHTNPAAMLEFSILENIRISVTATWPLALGLYLIGAPTVIWLAIFFVSFGNGVHWFSHQRKVNWFIKGLQKIGIFASFDHHKSHHAIKGRLIDRGSAVEKYCVMTDWVNPILDAIRFFRILEALLALRSQKPSPAIAEEQSPKTEFLNGHWRTFSDQHQQRLQQSPPHSQEK